ncbi:hypothetical protein PC129_g1962 [Phytophthora cactorum]|uniref:Reverse transcriptase Ty1/copia-type domain-containing protein n=1 Tax=Phytophthora cactorum TaxID=29920 RepID=A0A329S998_9STRA|nr:hypothetical protein Pcac1_g19722 [Phytophthora cactorum]KAG2830260.1 hypothetical protein PC112_g7775 [Phytophthora cactorum]KAG2832573.1 hypothetical protein PC111_g6562 [Phytophthora cactorum]KAG2863199.1 hypothetical protein PC113_g5643 [Phytophthora cactorum]KAG2920712.1 hypothetical protein PC114_g5978 [Phytophthora cactorum]
MDTRTPYLYYRIEDEKIMLVLAYVDDILVSSNDGQREVKLFEDLDVEYGIKDQGLLAQYLGVEVVQTAEYTTIGQTKYSREFLEKFGYGNAHAVGNPMGRMPVSHRSGKTTAVTLAFPIRKRSAC